VCAAQAGDNEAGRRPEVGLLAEDNEALACDYEVITVDRQFVTGACSMSAAARAAMVSALTAIAASDGTIAQEGPRMNALAVKRN
jgi:hypothetical protein